MDVGCYCVSALRLICGAEPERVSGEQVLGGDGVDARFAGVLRFPGDVLGTLRLRHGRPPPQLDRGRRQRGHDPRPVAVADAGSAPDPGHRGDEMERIEPESVDPYARELEEFGRAVDGGPPPRLGRADALGQARAIEALYRAAEDGPRSACDGDRVGPPSTWRRPRGAAASADPETAVSQRPRRLRTIRRAARSRSVTALIS